MCDDPNFEFQFRKEPPPSPKDGVPQCDVCGEAIDLGVPESYDKVYWRCYNRDLYTHIACF
jgi:hypothetical protein